MKKRMILMAALVVAFGIGTLMAQDQKTAPPQKPVQNPNVTRNQSTMHKMPTNEERADRMVARLTQQLKLSDSQQKQAKLIYADFYKERENMAKEGQHTADRSKMDQLIQNRDKQMKDILSEQQYTDYMKMNQEMVRPAKRPEMQTPPPKQK
jgi:hypothetical protein